MTPYGTKMNQLARLCVIASSNRQDSILKFGTNEYKVACTADSDARDTLRQHIEQGEPDCRLCKWHDRQGCVNIAKCVNFSLFDYYSVPPLCEVTK